MMGPSYFDRDSTSLKLNIWVARDANLSSNGRWGGWYTDIGTNISVLSEQVLPPPTTTNTQDIREMMREHIFSKLFTKTELLIAPCWR